ncbi:MAG: hypothetical protein CMM61_08175 [Rhodospirillaceae bacterium]|nr:hypothetical protein [Rhodospirillaceae bacterium]
MDLALIEEAIETQLKAVATAKGLSLKVDAYGGQLEDEKLDDLAQNCPAALIAISGLTRARRAPHSAEFDITATVIVAANSLNDDMARRGGRGGRHIGAYNLIKFAVSALNGFGTDPALSPDPDSPLLSAPLLVTAVQNLFNANVSRRYLAVYGVPFQGRVTVANDLADELDDLTDIYVSSIPSPAADDGENTEPIEAEIPQRETE